jgi:signal transduction histidine kinase
LLCLYQEAQSSSAEQKDALIDKIRQYSQRIDLAYTVSNLDGLFGRSREGLKRIQQIVKDLRDFARLDEGDLHEADLNAGIASTLNIIRGRAVKKNVQVEPDFAPLPLVTCYAAKINQVVLNLVANAIDACSEGGKVVVRSRPTAAGVELEVSDNGSGVPPAIRDKIFDPFFTTKPPGQGTGLGLSISHGIVLDHGGRIEVEYLSQGTTFRIVLPLTPPGVVLT